MTVLDCQNKHLEKELLVIKAFVDRVRYDDKGVVTVRDCHNMHLDNTSCVKPFDGLDDKDDKGVKTVID